MTDANLRPDVVQTKLKLKVYKRNPSTWRAAKAERSAGAEGRGTVCDKVASCLGRVPLHSIEG